MVFQEVVLFGEVRSVDVRVVGFEGKRDVKGGKEFSESAKEESRVIMVMTVSASTLSAYMHKAFELILLSSSLPWHFAGEKQISGGETFAGKPHSTRTAGWL
jgi:hypothetical protein